MDSSGPNLNINQAKAILSRILDTKRENGKLVGIESLCVWNIIASIYNLNNLYVKFLLNSNMTLNYLRRMFELSRVTICAIKTVDYSNVFNPNLYNSNLYNLNLYNSNLYNSNLYNSNLYNLNLYNSNLYNLSLYNSNLYNSNLYDPNFYNPNLYNSNLYSLTGPHTGLIYEEA